jgi:hypothetical protein
MAMKKITIIILKLLLLIGLLIGMNGLYRLFFYKEDIQKHSDVIYLVQDVIENGSEVVYVGESSNITFRNNDLDKRSISGFIADYFPNLKVDNITKAASHAGIYYELLNNIPPDSKIKTVIVTLNLRSFNAEWIYSKLETPLQKSVVMLKDHPPLWNRFMLSFKGYDIKTDAERSIQIHYEWMKNRLQFPYPFPYKNVREWDKAKATAGIHNADGAYNQELTSLACHYIKTYAFQIDTLTNPRIKDFDKIVKLAKARNWNLIFNLMAENVEMADRLVGKDLLFLMKQNRDLLAERYGRMGVTVVDNLCSVPDEEFIDRDWTTEHYAEQGRKIVAHNVAQALKTFYPNQYQDIQYANEKPTHFFNNCDGDIVWTQWHTLSRENSFSGSKSSKTGKGELYGLTFEHSIQNLPDSLKTVSVEMQIFQEDLAHNAEILLEITGLYVKSFPLLNATNVAGKWQKISCQFDLGENFYNGNIVKVYLYNPFKTVIYCDDIHIEFR